MEKVARTIIIPAAAAGAYAGVVLFLFIFAMIRQDKFDFLPACLATYPLSFILIERSNLSQNPSILIGGGVNTGVLFALFWFFVCLGKSAETK